MKVLDVMTPGAKVCYGDTSLAEAAKMMWENSCGILPVVESMGGKLCGVITDRDICMGGMTQGLKLHEIPVRHCCSREIHRCRPDDDLATVHALMREHRLHRVPVVGEKERVLGIVSLDDLALAACRADGETGRLAREDLATTLGAVAEGVASHRAAEAAED
ncbi:MAG: CBS domain-containing protein [Planctomycetota bacterium]